MGVRIKEADTLAELKEMRQKVMELETQVISSITKHNSSSIALSSESWSFNYLARNYLLKFRTECAQIN